MILKVHSYITTALEDWVTSFYLRHKILHPNQINIRYIARIHDIFIHQKPKPACYEILGRYRGIVLDKRTSKEVQREQFFHELAHILRHSGIQSMMPAAFRELQEWDAHHFTKYAAIPFHMLKFIDFEQDNVVTDTAQLFRVTPELAMERLLQIQRRMNEVIYYERQR